MIHELENIWHHLLTLMSYACRIERSMLMTTAESRTYHLALAI